MTQLLKHVETSLAFDASVRSVICLGSDLGKSKVGSRH